jgi:hypothetical protein
VISVIVVLLVCLYPFIAMSRQADVFAGYVIFPNNASGVRFCAIHDPCRMYVVPIYIGYDAHAFIMIIAGAVDVVDNSELRYAVYPNMPNVQKNEDRQEKNVLKESIVLFCFGIVLYGFSTIYLRRRNNCK